MSKTQMFPVIPPVGGLITQHVLTEISHEVKAKPKNHGHFLPKQRVFSPNKRVELEKSLDTARYRNSFFHNLCLEMLQDGFHMAFCELFNLVQQQKSELESSEYFERTGGISIEEHEEKLSIMKNLLVQVETWRRQGRADKVYDAQLTLATCFMESGDHYLSDHFFQESFTTSKQIHGDGGRKQAEANCNLGVVAKRNGDYQKAADIFEQFYFLTRETTWVDSNGASLHMKACDHLQEAYVTLAEQLPKDDQIGVMDLLHKAYNVAKEGEDVKIIGKIVYLIGNKYDFYKDQESTLKYHTEFYELCQSNNDDAGLGKACQALAAANLRQGNYTTAVDHLKEFLRVTKKSGSNESRREACSDLGAVYNCMGKYELSANYYKRAFELSQRQDNMKRSNNSSCEYAIALAHGLMTGEAEHIFQNNAASLDVLLYWKSERVQGFSDDQQTFKMFESLHARRQEEKRKIQNASHSPVTHTNLLTDNQGNTKREEGTMKTESE